MRHATIKDVAAAAGVSVGTASKALNGQGKLRAETVARVLRAAEQLAFVPNVLAQSLLAALAGEAPRGVRRVAARLVIRRSSGGDGDRQ